jgi:hypothetical protein
MSTLATSLEQFQKAAALRRHQADKLVEVKTALQKKDAEALKKALSPLSGPWACSYLLEGMMDTASKPMAVAKMLGRIR